MKTSLRRQLGFIYLMTGANGTGKTLFTLKDVREKQIAEGRSVFYHGFDMYPDKAAEFGWQKMDDATKWQDYPKGAIFIIDEAHNTFPLRPNGSKVPDYVAAMAEHRKHGFDFFLLDQGPRNIDKFLHPLIATPGCHVHLKRNPAIDMSSCLKWTGVNVNCEKAGQGKSAEISQRAFPKEVYTWYKSADQHTAVKRIPKQVFVLLACLVLIPLAGYFAWSKLESNSTKFGGSETEQKNLTGSGVVAPSGRAVGPLTAAEFVDSFQARLEGFPNTAPRYDDVTRPTVAPYPAACVESRRGCDCYTQQGTRLAVPLASCKSIVAGGYFVDWDTRTPGEREVTRKPSAPLSDASGHVADVDHTRDGEMLAAMRSGAL